MRTRNKAAALLVAIATCSGALIAGAAAPATAAPTQAAPSDTRASSEDSPADSMSAQREKHTKYLWHTAKSYWGTSVSSPTGGGGKLYAGWNYFYCQEGGNVFSDQGYTNSWWLKTDDDSGHSMVWVSAVYVSGGDDWERIPGIPEC